MNRDDRRTLDDEGDQGIGESVMLDGNAVGGILSEIFVPDVTAARAKCASCGAIRALGALLVYPHGMGTVMRCPACYSLVLRVARTPAGLWLDATGASFFVMAGTAAFSA